MSHLIQLVLHCVSLQARTAQGRVVTAAVLQQDLPRQLHSLVTTLPQHSCGNRSNAAVGPAQALQQQQQQHQQFPHSLHQAQHHPWYTCSCTDDQVHLHIHSSSTSSSSHSGGSSNSGSSISASPAQDQLQQHSRSPWRSSSSGSNLQPWHGCSDGSPWWRLATAPAGGATAATAAASCWVARPAGSTRGLSSGSTSSRTSSTSSSSHPAATWVDKYLPLGLQPYAQLMRLDKPIGSWLLAWPGLWSIALAAPPGHLPDIWLTTLFATGAVLMRGAGCTINDLWDKDIDKKVDRTRTRPLAAGTISQRAALAFLAGQLLLSLSILLQLNTYTQVLGVCSLALVATYPLMKRVTFWPQAFLGLCMNYGVLMGDSAAAGACDWSVVLPMYTAGINWTLVYDTIYAHQDKKDDVIVGVKSTALLFGDKTKEWATGFAVLQTLGLGLAGQAAGCGGAYYAAVAAGAAHQAWQIRSVDLNNGPDCMAKFVSNKWYGAILYAGIVADRLLAV